MSNAERRRHVRLKPTSDLPARAMLVVEGPVQEVLTIMDISVGGMALAAPAGGGQLGKTMNLRVSFAHHGEHNIRVAVRWTRADAVGVEFLDPSTEAAHAIRRYCAELLERGASM